MAHCVTQCCSKLAIQVHFSSITHVKAYVDCSEILDDYPRKKCLVKNTLRSILLSDVSRPDDGNDPELQWLDKRSLYILFLSYHHLIVYMIHMQEDVYSTLSSA